MKKSSIIKASIFNLMIIFTAVGLFSKNLAAEDKSRNNHNLTTNYLRINLDDISKGAYSLEIFDETGWLDFVHAEGYEAKHFQIIVRDNDEKGIDKTLSEINTDLYWRYQIEESDQAYRFRLTITLFNQGDELLKLQDKVATIRLGPGIGNQAIEGLGYAENLYSFIEFVGFVNGSVEHFRANAPGDNYTTSDAYNWFGLQSRYFALLLAPVDPEKIHSIEVKLDENASSTHEIEVATHLNLTNLNPKQSKYWTFDVYIGPKTQELLSSSVYTDFSSVLLSNLWRWMQLLTMFLMSILSLINAVIPNWGISIIILAILVRIILSPIATNAMKSQKEFVDVQKKIDPELKKIKANFKGEEQSERMLKLYESYNVSPLAGLKPLLIVLLQLPILIALFHGLGTFFDLRSASFLWIQSLGEPDKLIHLGMNIPIFGEYINLLPFLMTIVTLAALKLSPTTASDKTSKFRQNIFLIFMALMFFVLFYPFPSGMVLYWTVANILHIFQHRLIYRQIN